MRTLHPAYRITDLAASLAFYGAIGFEQVGRVDLGDGVTLTMLKFPADEVVTLELVHRPPDGPVVIGSGFSHLAVQVDDLGGMIEAVTKAGLSAGPVERPGGLDGPQTSWLRDPDGYRIELVQWPPGHAYGITAADFGQTPDTQRRHHRLHGPDFRGLSRRVQEMRATGLGQLLMPIELGILCRVPHGPGPCDC
jgi:lactoylglutathione lyase